VQLQVSQFVRKLQLSEKLKNGVKDNRHMSRFRKHKVVKLKNQILLLRISFLLILFITLIVVKGVLGLIFVQNIKEYQNWDV